MMVVAEDQDETPPPDILKGDQLTTEQLDQLQVVLDLAKDTFSDEPGTTDVCTHAVDTGDCKQIRSNPYAISPIKLAGVKQEIQDLLQKGIITSSTSPWSSPIVPLLKPDKSVRLCVDYRQLNKSQHRTRTACPS